MINDSFSFAARPSRASWKHPFLYEVNFTVILQGARFRCTSKTERKIPIRSISFPSNSLASSSLPQLLFGINSISRTTPSAGEVRIFASDGILRSGSRKNAAKAAHTTMTKTARQAPALPFTITVSTAQRIRSTAAQTVALSHSFLPYFVNFISFLSVNVAY